MQPPNSESKGSGFDMSMAPGSTASVQERIEAIQKMITTFVMNNMLEHLFNIYPEGATGPELEALIKRRAKEEDPDQETLMLSNMVTNKFMDYYFPALKALIGSGNIYAGEDEKFFLRGAPPDSES